MMIAGIKSGFEVLKTVLFLSRTDFKSVFGWVSCFGGLQVGFHVV